MWWCGGPTWAGWGMPFGMFLMPLFFLLAVFLVFRCFSRGFAVCGRSHLSDNPLADEVRKLRQEVEELRKDKK